DNDPTCSATELQSDNAGLWSATFPVPAGNYSYRIVVSSDQDYSLGQNGDPNGKDLKLNVPDGAIGAYFSYDQNTGQIIAAPVTNGVELATDLGSGRMPRTADGGYEVYVDAQPNSQFNAQVLFDGNPATDQVQISTGDSGRVHVVADANGNITGSDQ